MRNSVSEWDLPQGVLGEILDLLSLKRLVQCACVAKSWRNAVEENRKVKLERAWRFRAIQPKRSKFGLVGGEDLFDSAKQGDTIAFKNRNGIGVGNVQNGRFFCRNEAYSRWMCFVDGVLLSGDEDPHTVRVWKVPELTETGSFRVHGRIADVVNVCENRIAISGPYGYLGLWRKGDWSPFRILVEGDNNWCRGILCLAVFQELLFCGLRSGHVFVWSLKSYRRVEIFEVCDLPVDNVQVNESVIICGFEDCFVRVLGRQSGECLRVIESEGILYSQHLALSDTKFACQLSLHEVELWDIDKGCCFRTFPFKGTDVAGLYLTVEKLTMVQTNGEVLEYDFAAAIA